MRRSSHHRSCVCLPTCCVFTPRTIIPPRLTCVITDVVHAHAVCHSSSTAHMRVPTSRVLMPRSSYPHCSRVCTSRPCAHATSCHVPHTIAAHVNVPACRVLMPRAIHPITARAGVCQGAFQHRSHACANKPCAHAASIIPTSLTRMYQPAVCSCHVMPRASHHRRSCE
jgi:hypothetical protein